MSISEAILKYRKETGTSQREISEKALIDRGSLSKIERGKKKLPETYDAGLSSVNYSIALEVAEERTGNFVPNVLDDGPHYQLYPSAIKERVMQSLRELSDAYSSVPMYGPVSHQSVGRKLYHANRRALEWLLVNQGKIIELFHLDAKRMAKEHELMNKEAEKHVIDH